MTYERTSRKQDFFKSVFLFLLITLPFSSSPVHSTQLSEKEKEYLEKFEKKFPLNTQIQTLEEYATPDRYDTLYLSNLSGALQNVTNDAGGMAWGLSYRMISLNLMYRNTRDPKYLHANLRCIRAAMNARDDVRGEKLWIGETAPVWSCKKYTEHGRTAFAVHTGMITYPMLDFLSLVRNCTDVLEPDNATFREILQCATEALAWHDPQWRSGPGEGEGHYIGRNQEEAMEGKPLPANRLSAMGRALWTAWKVTGKPVYRDRAVSIARYIKRRLGRSEDGAYYWSYWLPLEPVTEPVLREEVSGEDTSHAGLTASFPLLLASEDTVFGKEDLRRFGFTVVNGFGRLGDGILLGTITGDPGLSPEYVWGPARWLVTSSEVPEVPDRIIPFFLKHVAQPFPLDLAYLIAFKNCSRGSAGEGKEKDPSGRATDE